MGDINYKDYIYSPTELNHRYGDNIHLTSNPVLLTQLARLSSPHTVLPEINTLVRELYRSLIESVVAGEFPRSYSETPTRMLEFTPRGVWSGDILSPNTKVVTAGIARAGTYPSQVIFEFLTALFNPNYLRQDHIYMSRTTNAAGAVDGVSVAGSKIGGDIKNSIVLLPDPMGATGGSICHAISMYKKIGKQKGAPLKIVTMNLIITPEYLKRVSTEHPDVIIYGLRLDRGLTDEALLNTQLGETWEAEKGLNNQQYIIPGAGGVGEVMNNSFV